MPLAYQTAGEMLRRFAEVKRQRVKLDARRTKKWHAMRAAMIDKRTSTTASDDDQ